MQGKRETQNQNVIIMEDERKGKPSASGMSRLALCPGSWNLESTLPEQEENKYMKLGTDIHAVLADQKPFEELTPEGQDIANRIVSDYASMLDHLNLGNITKSIKEERFWYDDLFSGAIDAIDFFGDEVAVVTDYKTGRNAQSKASENYQLRAYAVLVKRAFPALKTIYVALIQPMAASKTIAEYNEQDLEDAEDEIIGIVRASQGANVPRIPSPDACKWCRAKDICPDRYNKAQATTRELEVVSKVVVSSLSNAELISLDDKADQVEDFIVSIREEIKKRMLAGQQLDGRELKKGRITRNVTDTTAVISALSGVIDSQDVLACAKISVSSLEKAFAKAKGIKQKDAKAALDDALGWLIESKEGEPSVARTK
jgi:CRISPR/Cas system-associated exonuclease Cas4 (RecB family)